MAEIKAFKGYIYNSDKIDDLGKVTSPPYDAISPDVQQEYYDIHEYNAIRLAKGKRYESDTDTDNPSTRAGAYLADWIKNDILKRDLTDAIYLYEQEVEFNRATYSNKGFVSLLALDGHGKSVLPCEEAAAANKENRYKLLETTKANFNMISCLYIESEKDLSRVMTEIADSPADISFTTNDGTKERLWRICDKEKIDFITNALKPHTVYILDGQNRYESSLMYQAECAKNNPSHTGLEPYNYIMTYFTNSLDDSLVHIPYHRLVRFKKSFNESFFVAACQDNFKIEKIIVDTDTSDFVDTIKKQIATTRLENKIGLYCGGEYFYRLTLRDNAPLKKMLPEKSDAYISLDVTVLNKLILEDILNICEADFSERIEYTKSVTEGIKSVRDGEFGCLFAINPVKTEQIRGVTIAGEKMPSHSICVFPKPVTGIILNIME